MDLRDALFDAVVKGDETAVLYVLNIGGSLAINDSKGFTVLHWAASNKFSEKLVPMLIARKANVNAIDNNGQTPLHVHCARGCAYGVACLLYHGANPNCRTTDHNISPLDIAEAHRQDEIVKLLLTFGAIPSGLSGSPKPSVSRLSITGAAGVSTPIVASTAKEKGG